MRSPSRGLLYSEVCYIFWEFITLGKLLQTSAIEGILLLGFTSNHQILFLPSGVNALKELLIWESFTFSWGVNNNCGKRSNRKTKYSPLSPETVSCSLLLVEFSKAASGEQWGHPDKEEQMHSDRVKKKTQQYWKGYQHNYAHRISMSFVHYSSAKSQEFYIRLNHF